MHTQLIEEVSEKTLIKKIPSKLDTETKNVIKEDLFKSTHSKFFAIIKSDKYSSKKITSKDIKKVGFNDPQLEILYFNIIKARNIRN